MSFDSICALLSGEPWHYRPWEIRRLTFYQINHILFHARDDKGQIEPVMIGPAPPSDEECIKNGWRERFHLNDEQVEQRWNEFIEVEGYRYHLEQALKPAQEIEKLVARKWAEVVQRRVEI